MTCRLVLGTEWLFAFCLDGWLGGVGVGGRGSRADPALARPLLGHPRGLVSGPGHRISVLPRQGGQLQVLLVRRAQQG